MLKKNYTMATNQPVAISWDNYKKLAIDEYKELLISSKDERVFQHFFERNPAFVPGITWAPHGEVLISQPKIQGIRGRFPDFMWLRDDSLTFSPVLIEIESPLKKLFTKQGQSTAQFTEARNQLVEWKTILDGPTARQQFYDDFAISLDLRKKKFKPVYILVYGRREEFAGNDLLMGKRANLMGEQEELVSFDRLQPHSAAENVISVLVRNKEYLAMHIMPTFRFSPSIASDLVQVSNLEGVIDVMEHVTEARKVFIRERLPYWRSYAQNKGGIIGGADYE